MLLALINRFFPVHLKTTTRQAKSYSMNLIIKYIFSIFCFLCYCSNVFFHSLSVLLIQINGTNVLLLPVISYVLYITIYIYLSCKRHGYSVFFIGWTQSATQMTHLYILTIIWTLTHKLPVTSPPSQCDHPCPLHPPPIPCYSMPDPAPVTAVRFVSQSITST